MITQLKTKFSGILYRLMAILRSLPVRIQRLFNHLWKGLLFLFSSQQPKESVEKEYSTLTRIGLWWLSLFCYILDVFGFPEIFEIIKDFVKFNSRPLHDWEVRLAESIFEDTIDYRRVRIDEFSLIGPRQKKFCYVSFYVINSWGEMQNSIFIHEMTHIWQFEKMGSVYIPLALMAQHSIAGYNYGGVAILKNCSESGKSFRSFNLEQQGDIIADFYRIKEGFKPIWGDAQRVDLPVYESFVEQLRSF